MPVFLFFKGQTKMWRVAAWGSYAGFPLHLFRQHIRLLALHLCGFLVSGSNLSRSTLTTGSQGGGEKPGRQEMRGLKLWEWWEWWEFSRPLLGPDRPNRPRGPPTRTCGRACGPMRPAPAGLPVLSRGRESRPREACAHRPRARARPVRGVHTSALAAGCEWVYTEKYL